MSSAKILPPRGFKPAGVIEWVKHSQYPPPFIRNQRRYGRRAEGIRYERKVQDYLEETFAGLYVPSPWFLFKEVGVDKPRWCQPDGLVILPYTGQITIVECKLQHTADAWWQLKFLYLPVIANAFPHDLWQYGICEVVKWYDPATTFPEKVKMRASLKDSRPNEFGVHILKP